MLWAYLALGALWLGGAFAISLGAVVGHHVSVDSGGGLTSLDNPGGSDAWWGAVQAVFFPAVAACWLVWLVGQVLSFRRSSGERRQQLKWLLGGAVVFIAAGIGLVWTNNPTGWLRVVDLAAAVGTIAFAARLQDAVDLGTVRSDLVSTVDRTLEPAHVAVWTAPTATASRPE